MWSFVRILGYLSRMPSGRLLSGPGFKSRNDLPTGGRIDRVCRLVVENYADGVGLSEAARTACMSPAAFCRYFKGVTGHTFVEFLNKTRVDAATRLLLETDRPITEICYNAGFGNISNFNRRFRKLKGLSPSEYRKTMESCSSRIRPSD